MYRARLPYDAVRDFAPIGLAVKIPFLLLVHPSLPAQDVAALIALARRRPGQLNYASAGTGGATHLATELFKSTTGTDIVHVPYKGAAPSMTDLMAGQVDFSLIGPPTALPAVRSGRLRALATTGAQRLGMFPGVPTMAEAGVARYEFTQWYGLLAPGRTSRDIVMALHAALLRALDDPDMKRRIADQGGTSVSSTPEEFVDCIKSELEKSAQTLRSAGIRRE